MPGRAVESAAASRPPSRTAARPTVPRSPAATCATARARAGACAGAAGTSSSATSAAAASARVRRRIWSSLTNGAWPTSLSCMEAASPTRELSGDKAQRIVDAMRTSVGLRGATGSTFDHVAREAGVSRGLLHYYFGTKERLLVEVVRRDCDLRMDRMSETVAGLDSADALLDALVRSLNETLADAPEFFVILFELHTLGLRNDEIAVEVAELNRRVREHLAGLLEQARDAGVIRLAGAPEAVSEVLFALADGLALRILAEPAREHGAALAIAQQAARAL